MTFSRDFCARTQNIGAIKVIKRFANRASSKLTRYAPPETTLNESEAEMENVRETHTCYENKPRTLNSALRNGFKTRTDTSVSRA